MVRKYPNYLEKVVLYDKKGLQLIPCAAYEEICKIALDAGFRPSIQNYYVASYDIMKKVIPLELSLIEKCKVNDELCNLALACGYEVKVVAQYSMMCSNYELMKRYVAIEPSFLKYIEICDSDEILNLIDIAIKSGLPEKELVKCDFLKLFLQVDESKWSNYFEYDTIDFLKKVRKFWINNNEIMNVLKCDFLDDKIVNHFSETQIEILSCYPNLQEKIIELSSMFPFKANLIYELVNRYKVRMD